MGILSEAYKDHPVEHKHITPIDFNSIKQIPESHAWVQSNNEPKTTLDHNKKQELGFTPISKIDLEDPNVLELLFHACEIWGVFQITNHGISHELLEKVESQAKRLFSLPLKEKMKVLRSPDGATGYGSPRITPFFSKLMWCEGFTIMGNSLVDHAKELWPHDYLEFCDVMDEYQAKMKGLADKLMGLILKSLKIPESVVNWANQDPAHDPKNICTALQLNSYPTCPDPAQTMGLAPHTDTFLFTILHQSGNANGLQVFKDGPGWASVDPDPDALVVNVGDLLHIISNARFPSVVHRAIVNNEKHRISVAYFYGPPLDFRVSPFVDYPGCEGPLFRCLEVKEYVGIKAKHLDLALSYVRT